MQGYGGPSELRKCMFTILTNSQLESKINYFGFTPKYNNYTILQYNSYNIIYLLNTTPFSLTYILKLNKAVIVPFTQNILK